MPARHSIRHPAKKVQWQDRQDIIDQKQLQIRLLVI